MLAYIKHTKSWRGGEFRKFCLNDVTKDTVYLFVRKFFNFVRGKIQWKKCVILDRD